ncbi:hypothetical protein NLU13_7273 [Sarocladium strictum]|uniref:Uncharacterized protein n=1 Tax=Sarocladium strictum TaxID=5046 RepID=A0AA39GCI3_SARSR|nr:hypothetical protein NLU13_7273 [Sarocladium strictum]
MSGRESRNTDHGYDTPVPELDDHRHRTPSTQKYDRPRRGTFDSLYRTRPLDDDVGTPGIKVRDFEEAVVDGDAQEPEHDKRERRPTTDTADTDGRSMSPPNSVKAFAEARRRERGPSFIETIDEGAGRALSISSRRSLRSKQGTVNDAGSILTNKTAEEDVCFPMQDNYRKNQLYIDFEYLESFIQAEKELHMASRGETKEEQSFQDLRPQSVDKRMQLATIDGDILDMPSDESTTPEKHHFWHHTAPETKHQPPVDNNRFSFFSSAWESTIHAAEMGDLVLPGEDIRGLFELPEDEPDGVWWLNVNSATKEEISGICRAFGVHPLTIEDIITQEAREKIELFPSYYFASFRSFHVVEEPEGKEYEPLNIFVLVFREGTLSFSFEPNSHASHVRKRITALKDYVALSSDWICYALIDDIVDSFAVPIHQLELEADAIEDEVFVMRTDDSSAFLRSIGQARKNVMALLRLLGGKADVLRGFTKRCNENYQVTPRMDIGMYLSDIQDHVVTMATNLGHFEKILSRAHSNYLAMLSINNIEQGTDTNRVLGKITFLASIIVPLNLVSGVFGMNVTVPFEGTGQLGPFFGIIGVMVVLISLILVWARHLKYI